MALNNYEDFEWLGVDCEGHIARFTNAGSGPVPNEIMGIEQVVRTATSALGGLPQICDAEMMVTLPNPADFTKLSGAGFFGYDWDDPYRSKAENTGQYSLISRPLRPRVISEVSADIEKAVFVKFPDLKFGSETSIDVASIMSCMAPG